MEKKFHLNDTEEVDTVYVIVRSQDDHMVQEAIGYTEKQAYDTMVMMVRLYVAQILGERYLPEKGNYWDADPTDAWIYIGEGGSDYIRWKILKIVY